MSDFAGGQGNVEFKESIGLQLVVKFDQWLAGLQQSEKAMNEFGADVVKFTNGMTSGFIAAQTKLEKSASKITGMFKAVRNELAKTTAVWGTASLAMAQHAATIERSMFALEKAAQGSGRSFSGQLQLIEDSIGGVASRADLLASSVSMMTTALDPNQMKQFVDVVKDTSAALGTDFSANIEHAVASLKTMDIRLLANMGIMVDQQEVIKKMAIKFPGADPETLSLQQKQAALLDVIIDKTRLFAGANKEISEKGLMAWAEFKENLKDISIAIGKMFIPAWNEVAKVLAYVTKGIKNFFENESVQKFGATVAKIVVPAMMLLLTAFTALVPIVGILLKIMTVAPFVALTMAVVQFTKVLVGTGSVTQAMSAFGGALKKMPDPISLVWNGLKVLKAMYGEVGKEMTRMATAGEASGKTFTNMFVAIKNIWPQLKAMFLASKTATDVKNITGVPIMADVGKDAIAKAKEIIGPIKGFREQVSSFGVAIKSVFSSLAAGAAGGIDNVRKMGAALMLAFGKGTINMLAAFRNGFLSVVAAIRIGTVAMASLARIILKVALPLVVFTLAIEGVFKAINMLKEAYIRHKHGSAALRDEVEALKKEYESLAKAMNKAKPKEQKATRQDIYNYAERENKAGKNLTDEWLKNTKVEEAQTKAGRNNIRAVVDQKRAMIDLRNSVSDLSVEYEKLATNYGEIALKANSSYMKVKTFIEGLKIQENMYESILSKASRMNDKDLQQYIAKIESERKLRVDEYVASAQKLNPGISDKEIEDAKKQANKFVDDQIAMYKDPKLATARLQFVRNGQSALRDFMKSDDFTAELIAQIKIGEGKIKNLESEMLADKEGINRDAREKEIEGIKTVNAQKLALVEENISAELNAYKGYRDQLVSLFEAEQFNKLFLKLTNSVKTFSIQVQNVKPGNMVKVTDAIKTAITPMDNMAKATVKTARELKGAAFAVDMMADAMGRQMEYGEGMIDILGLAGKSYDYLYNKAYNFGKVVAGLVASGVGKLSTELSKTQDDFKGIGDSVSNIKTGKMKDLIITTGELGDKVKSTGINVDEFKAMLKEFGDTAGTTDEEFKKLESSMGALQQRTVSMKFGGEGLKLVGDTIEELDAKLNKISFDKARFEFATLQVITDRTFLSIGKSLEKIKAFSETSEAAKTMMTELMTNINEEVTKWNAQFVNSSRELINNQKQVLSAQRQNVNEMANFAVQLADAARAIEVANQNITSIKRAFAEQADPVIEAQKAVLELQAQEKQAIGDVVGFHMLRIELLKKELESQQKLAVEAKKTAQTQKLTAADRLSALQREQQARLNSARVGSELQRMDQRLGGNPETELNQAEKIGEEIKKVQEEMFKANMAVAELQKRIAELDMARIKEEQTLAQKKYEMDMNLIGEQRGQLVIQQNISKAQLDAAQQTALALSTKVYGENDPRTQAMKEGFAEANKKIIGSSEESKAIKQDFLKSAGVQEKSMSEMTKGISESNAVLSQIQGLMTSAKSDIGGLQSGITKAFEVNIDKYSETMARILAEEMVKKEQKLSGTLEKAPKDNMIAADTAAKDAIEKASINWSTISQNMLNQNTISSNLNKELIGKIEGFQQKVVDATINLTTGIGTSMSSVVDAMRQWKDKPVQLSINVTSTGKDKDNTVDILLNDKSWKTTTNKQETLGITFGDLGWTPGG